MSMQEMALKLLQQILKQGTKVSSKENVEMLFDFIEPLVETVPGTSCADDEVHHLACLLETVPKRSHIGHHILCVS